MVTLLEQTDLPTNTEWPLTDKSQRWAAMPDGQPTSTWTTADGKTFATIADLVAHVEANHGKQRTVRLSYQSGRRKSWRAIFWTYWPLIVVVADMNLSVLMLSPLAFLIVVMAQAAMWALMIE